MLKNSGNILGFFAVLLLLFVAGFVVYLRSDKSSDLPKTQIEKIEKSTPESTHAKPLSSEPDTDYKVYDKKFQQLQAQLQAQQANSLQEIKLEIAQLARRVGVMERDLAARPLPKALALLRDINQTKQDLEKKILSLSQKIHQPKGSSFALLGLAMIDLKRATHSGGDFSNALENMMQLLSSPTLEAMKPYAQGVPSRAALYPLFEKSAASTRGLAADISGSPFLAMLLKVVRIRPVGEIKGDDAFALLSQIDQRAQRLDLQAVLDLEHALKAFPEVYLKMQNWFKLVQQRHRLDLLTAQLDLEVFQILVENQKNSTTPTPQKLKQERSK